MANWCFNTVAFTGEDDQIEKLQELFLNMQAQFILQDMGQLPAFIKKDNGYFFDIDMVGEVLTFLTKWTPALETIRHIADHFGVAFIYRYEEQANGIYGEAVYKDGISLDIFLEISDFSKYTYDDENELYMFDGNSYEDSTDILEILLERRKLNQEL